MVRCGYKPSRDISDTEETPATKPKTKKRITAVTRHHRDKPGPNVILEAETKNRKRFRRRPSRPLAHNFYNENRLVQRAAGVHTEAPKTKHARGPPKSEANENIQLVFDQGTPAEVAQLKKDYPENFDKMGNLKNRKNYSKAPVKKPTKKDVGTGEKLSGLLGYPRKHIRELYRHVTAERRAVMRKTYPEYATYVKSKEATRIPTAPEPPVDTEDPDLPKPPSGIQEVYRYSSAADLAETRERFSSYARYFDSKEATEIPPVSDPPIENINTQICDRHTGPPEYPGINQREGYAHGTSADKAWLRKDLPAYTWYFDAIDASDDGVIVPWKVKNPRISQVNGLPKEQKGKFVGLGCRYAHASERAVYREKYPEWEWYFDTKEAMWKSDEREMGPIQ
jgi:hypothetical protein